MNGLVRKGAWSLVAILTVLTMTVVEAHGPSPVIGLGLLGIGIWMDIAERVGRR